MNRNTNVRFSSIPTIDTERSRFDRSFSLKTTFSSGKLIPIMYDEVLPGDTITLDTSVVCRMSTPIFPVMDNCFLDVYYFFVPNRLVWDHWQEFMGEDTTDYWDKNPNYQIPQLKAAPTPDGQDYTFTNGNHNLCDYFGLPTYIFNTQASVSVLPFRAYYMIWNEFFRAQAVQDPVSFTYIALGTEDMTLSLEYEDIESLGSLYPSLAYQNMVVMPVGKFHDYFTSCLPSPQKGQPVFLPLGVSAPVITGDRIMKADLNMAEPFRVYSDTDPSTITTELAFGNGKIPSNLYADLANANTASIQDLRNAIVIQQFMEMEARGGSRYTEIIKTFFGVSSPDSRLQRPEYLGGKQIPINIDQVVQTSATNAQPSPAGSTSAFSLTGDVDNSFTYSATEHGMIIGLCCVRPNHTYQEGIEKKWSRKQRFDFYFPVFANISEQPVYQKELFLDPEDTDLDLVFGYQEAWAEYRYNLNRVTGGFRYNSRNSLYPWLYADHYEDNAPVLGHDFIQEDPDLIGGTLALQNDPSTQFLADFYFKSIWTRPMPVYSVPGLTRL